MIENVGGGTAGGPGRRINMDGPEKGKETPGARHEKRASGPQRPAEGDRVGCRTRRVKELRGVRVERVQEVLQRLQDGRLEGHEVLKSTAEKIVEQEL